MGRFEDARNHLLHHNMQLRSQILESSTTITGTAKTDLISLNSDRGITTSLSAGTVEIPGEQFEGGDTITEHSLSIWVELDSHGRTGWKPTKRVKISLQVWCKQCGAFALHNGGNICWRCSSRSSQRKLAGDDLLWGDMGQRSMAGAIGRVVPATRGHDRRF